MRAERGEAGPSTVDAGAQPLATELAAARPAPRYVCRTYPSVTWIPREVWDRMLPGEPEGWDFYRIAESVPTPGFKLQAVAVFDGETMVAVAPLFHTAYRLDTPLQGSLRRIGDRVYARWPRLVSLPVIGLGSPMSDNCALGFAPHLSAAGCAGSFSAMLTHLGREARAAGSALLAVKGLDRLAEIVQTPLERHGYSRVTSVPLAMLDLPYRDFEQYLAALPKKTRSYFRRKMRSTSQIRTEHRTDISGLEPRINALFENTLQQSNVDYGDFERLHPDYFTRIVRELGARAHFMLCWRGEELVSFQFSVIGRDCILAKQIGMQYPAARELNLYFINWLKLIEYAIERRIPRVEMGATTYATKLLFGGYLDRRWLHFRFRSAIANAALNPLAPLFDFERNDPELQRLGRSPAEMGPHSARTAFAAIDSASRSAAAGHQPG